MGILPMNFTSSLFQAPEDPLAGERELLLCQRQQGLCEGAGQRRRIGQTMAAAFT